MNREKRQVTGRGGYILGTVWGDFTHAVIQEPRIHTYHRMMLIGDPRRGGGAEQGISMGENPVAHPENHMRAIMRERGNLWCSQGLSRQGSVANDGMVSLDFGRDMAAGGQADSAVDISTSKQCSSVASNTGLPTSTNSVPTKEGAAGR